MRRYILAYLLLFFCGGLNAETVLADFEDDTWGALRLNKDYDGTLFSVKPAISANPDMTGINTSAKCVSATNISDADWWKNFIILELTTPVTIDDSNRILSLMAYRSIQPKDMRIGFNTYEESGQVYKGSLTNDATWENLTIDLGEDHLGETLSTIYIILSCNWDDPRSGWGEATYCFDNFTLSGADDIPNASVTINTNEKYQTIQNFGASDCWTAEYVGKYFSDSEKEKAAQWLFSKDKDANGNPMGIGLSCWRVNIGAGSATQGDDSNIEDITRRTECFINADGTYDWTRQAGQQYFMQKAKAEGVEDFILFSNSAPIYFTNNGLANAGGKSISCNLKDDCYDDFADFLATTTKHFEDEGYNIRYIDPINEPAFDWKDGQEGSPWENSNIASLAKMLDNSLTTQGCNAKILLTEASSWDLLYTGTGRASNQIYQFFDTSSENYIGNLSTLAKTIAGHSYWTFTTNEDLQSYREAVRDKANEYNLEAIQTEWSMLDAAPSTSAGFPASYDAATKMDIALYLSKVIYSDLTFGNMSAWHYWTTFAQEQWSQKNRFYLLRLNTSDDTTEESYSDLTKGGTITDDKNLWVLGNYSYFVRPDYKRISLSGLTDMNTLFGCGFIADDEQEVVAVITNMSSFTRKVDLSLSSTWSACDIEAYITNDDNDLDKVTGISSVNNIEIPAKSVMTIVLKKAKTDGISAVSGKVSQYNERMYNLQGQEVDDSYKGLVIRNGSKTVI